MAAALASIAEQSMDPQRFEVVLVNDGGPSVADVAKEDNLQRIAIRLVEHSVRVGKSAAINSGFDASRGDYICILDDDDLYYPKHLAVLAAAIQAEPDVAVFYTDTDIAVDPSGGVRSIIGNQSWEFDAGELNMMRRAPIACSICIQREAWSSVGGFDEHFSSVLDDWDFYMRLSQQFTFRHLQETTSQYTQPAGEKAFERLLAFEAGIERIRTKLGGTSVALKTGAALDEALDRLRRDYALAQREFQIAELRRQAGSKPQDNPLVEPLLGVSLKENQLSSLKALNTTSFEVEFVNRGAEPWCSNGGQYPIHLSYHWYQEDGSLEVWEGVRTPLPRDVNAGEALRARLLAHAPERPGLYWWRPALVQDGVQWVEPEPAAGDRAQFPVRIDP
jgi:glycosyltransferase involved in cell wall biosynthesis